MHVIICLDAPAQFLRDPARCATAIPTNHAPRMFSLGIRSRNPHVATFPEGLHMAYFQWGSSLIGLSSNWSNYKCVPS